jgi:hypothetical protein
MSVAVQALVEHPELCGAQGKWTADYIRLRFAAKKSACSQSPSRESKSRLGGLEELTVTLTPKNGAMNSESTILAFHINVPPL